MTREAVDDGWENVPSADDPDASYAPPPRKTIVTITPARTIISRNASPDIPFTQSINPYQGCEHGCIYCFARPTHAYLDLSPGLDFETRLFAKMAAEFSVPPRADVQHDGGKHQQPEPCGLPPGSADGER